MPATYMSAVSRTFADRWSERRDGAALALDPFAELGAALTVREALTVLAASLGANVGGAEGTGLPLRVEFDLCQAIVDCGEVDILGEELKYYLPAPE